MNKKKNIAKKNFIMSFISLVVCVAMLIGTTFAWFTDSVSSGVNRIQAGNLDVELEYYDNGWKTVDSSTKLFDDSALWEPGHTEVAYLHIKNAGSLDLKYKMNINVPSETGSINQKGEAFKLSDYLSFGTVVTSSETFYADNAEGRAAARAAVTSADLITYTKSGNLYAQPTSNTNEEYITLVIYMPETVGNEANHKTGEEAPQIELGVNVVATQLNSENDSFDNTYDEDSTYPVLAPVINSSDTVAPDTSNNTVISTPTATSTIPQGIKIASATNIADPGDVKSDVAIEENSSLTREIKTTGSNSDSVTYDISYKYSVTSGENTLTYDISEFSNVVENVITLTPGLKNVSVTHSHGETVTSMTKAVDASAKADGTYYYNEDSGELYIWSSKYSNYTVSYAKGDVRIGGRYFSTFSSAIDSIPDNNSERVTIEVESDIEFDTSFKISKKNITINGNNHKFIAMDSYSASAKTAMVDTKNSEELVFNNIIFDGNNKTYSLIGAGKDKTFNYCKFINSTNGHYYGVSTGNLTFKNCYFDCYMYNVNQSEGSCTVVFEDCYLSGWNSFGYSEKVSFLRTTFDKTSSNGYSIVRTYSNTTFTDCSFTESFIEHKDDKYGSGINPVKQSVAEINNCKVVTSSGVVSTNYSITDACRPFVGEEDPNDMGICVIDGEKSESKYIRGTLVGDEALFDVIIADGYCAVNNDDSTYSVEKSPLAYIDNFSFFEVDSDDKKVEDSLFSSDFSSDDAEKFCPHHTGANADINTHYDFVDTFVIKDGAAVIYSNSAWANFSVAESETATAAKVNISKTYKLQYDVNINSSYSRTTDSVLNTLTFNYGSWDGSWASECLSFAIDEAGKLGVYDSAPDNIGTKKADIETGRTYTIETKFTPTVANNEVASVEVVTSIIIGDKTIEINRFTISTFDKNFKGYCWDIYYPAN